MRKLILVPFFCLLIAAISQGQQIDAAFGVSTITSPSVTNVPDTFTPQSISGGAYPTLSANVIFLRNFGIGGEVSWRAKQDVYFGFQPYRPIFYDFNAVYAPNFGKRAGADLMAGIGAESLRFYQPYYTCGFTGCTNYSSSNHFLGHFGGGLRLYVRGNVFVRPEAHIYLVHNNFEFNSGKIGRFGMSIGYTFRPPTD